MPSIKKILNGKRLVFVLGAGASNDFGYPTGIELTNRIIGNNIAFVHDQFGPLLHSEFLNCFNSSGLNSIDAFLQSSENFRKENSQSKFLDIGKFCIASGILDKEAEGSLFKTSNNWYRYIYNLIHDDIDILKDGRIKFITFNYDLSLEHFFYTAILHSKFGISSTAEEQKEVAKTIESMGIIHIYGGLGSLDWMNPNDPFWKHRKYGILKGRNPETQINYIKECSKMIKLTRNGGPLHESFAFAGEVLKVADYICFLGFSFDRFNMAQFDFQNLFVEAERFKPSRLFLMGHGFGDAKRGLCANYFAGKQKAIVWSDPTDKIIDFLDKKFDVWF